MNAADSEDPEARRLDGEKTETPAQAQRTDAAGVEALLDFGRRFRATLDARGLRVEDLPGDDDLYDARGLPR